MFWRLAKPISDAAVNTTPMATHPHSAALPPDFVLRLQQTLAQAPVLHLWCPEPAALAAVREVVLHTLREQGAAVCSMSRGQWLPLLQTLNRWIEGSLIGTPLPAAGQAGVWLLEDAHMLSALQMDLLDTLLAQWPEWPMRLVLLSQCAQPPHQPTVGQRMAVEWLTSELPAWATEQAPAAQPLPAAGPGASHRRWPWAFGAVALAAGLWGIWSSSPVMAPAPQTRAEPVAPEASQALEAAASASEASAAPSEEASALAPSTPAEPAAPALPPQLRSWLQSLPEDSHVVLHGQFATEREARAFKDSHEQLANARIALAVWRSGESLRYGVLTGPFRTAERAQNHILRLAWREQASSLSREALLSP